MAVGTRDQPAPGKALPSRERSCCARGSNIPRSIEDCGSEFFKGMSRSLSTVWGRRKLAVKWLVALMQSETQCFPCGLHANGDVEDATVGGSSTMNSNSSVRKHCSVDDDALINAGLTDCFVRTRHGWTSIQLAKSLSWLTPRAFSALAGACVLQ